MSASVKSMSGLSIQRDGQREMSRALPEEVPVALVFDGTSQAVMMCTPADIEDFAKGFALTEGFIKSLDEIASFEILDHEAGIEARFALKGEPARALATRRRKMAGPLGCGLCGIDSIEEAVRPLPTLNSSGPLLSAAEVAGATDALRNHQPLHDQTHAMHAAGFFRSGEDVVIAREDVGRHNALDKLIGAMARAQINASDGAMVITSRVSIEMVQKCAMAGCAILIAVSAPTAHAVRLADAAGITLVAFAKGGHKGGDVRGGFDLYTHPQRVQKRGQE